MWGIIQKKRAKKETLASDDPLDLIIMGHGIDELEPKATEGAVSIELESPALEEGTIFLSPAEALELANKLRLAAHSAMKTH